MQAILWQEGKITSIRNDLANHNSTLKELLTKEVTTLKGNVEKGFNNRDMQIKKNHEMQVADKEAVEKKLGKVTKDSTRALGDQEAMQRLIKKEL